MSVLTQRDVAVDGLTLNVRTAGDPDHPAFILLHGWPQSGRAFEAVMGLLSDDFFVAAPDLPGVGGSRGAPGRGDKRLLARVVARLIGELGARSVILAGMDCGGMTAFPFWREGMAPIDGAVIMNTVVPGLEPWSKVIANPHMFHFALHAVPELPERLVAGREEAYFSYFYDALAHDRAAITPAMRRAYAADYARPEALKAGFDWYRAFPRDAEDNAGAPRVATPLLYLRGEHEPGNIDAYLEGLRQAGADNLTGGRIAGAGHFSPEEAPRALADHLRAFRDACDLHRAGRLSAA